MKTKLLLSLLLLFSGLAYSQDLTGTWEGSSTNAATYVKLVIVRLDDTYIGYTYDKGPGYCKVNFLGSFDATKQLLTGKGMGFIEKTFGHSQGRLKLRYERTGDVQYLKGTVSPKTTATKILAFGLSDKVILTRVDAAIDTTVFMSEWLQNHRMAGISAEDTLDEPGPVATLQPLHDTSVTIGSHPADSITNSIIIARQERSIDTLSTIITPAKNIVITIFDNGQVDGDTVTVFYNNEILLSRHFVSAIPYKINLSLSKEQPSHEIVLVANNLGSIPPNTALLIVEAGNKQYRLTAFSDLKRSASVIFEYRE